MAGDTLLSNGRGKDLRSSARLSCPRRRAIRWLARDRIGRGAGRVPARRCDRLRPGM